MNILVVNDDGIQSKGIWHLVQALSKAADVYVCAPDGQRSAKSHSITLGQEVIIQPVDFPGAKGALQTSGSPADCTKIGLQFFAEEGIKMDMVYSGINMGSNLGMDTLYSGTIGAAAEAAISGVQAVAVSADDHEATHFDTACKLAVDVIEHVYGQAGPVRGGEHQRAGPSRGGDQRRQNRFAGRPYYDDRFHRVEGSRYALSGQPADYSDSSLDYDLAAVYAGYATITPLRFDFTDRGSFETVEKWGLTI